MPTVAVINQKGGVGKTTVTLGLASAALAHGVSTLVVDLDSQGSATWSLGVQADDDCFTTSDVLAANRGGAADDALVTSGWGEGVDVVPASRNLAAREADVHRPGAPTRLRTGLSGVSDRYDLTLIDCAPSLGLNTVNALVAADLVLLVVEPAVLSLRGVDAVLDAIDVVWADLNPALDIAGVVVNRVPRVSLESERQYEALARLMGTKAIWKPPIPQRVAIAEAQAARAPVHGMGARGREVAEIFDTHLAKLRRVIRST